MTLDHTDVPGKGLVKAPQRHFSTSIRGTQAFRSCGKEFFVANESDQRNWTSPWLYLTATWTQGVAQ